jgi:hypothetical protein
MYDPIREKKTRDGFIIFDICKGLKTPEKINSFPDSLE